MKFLVWEGLNEGEAAAQCGVQLRPALGEDKDEDKDNPLVPGLGNRQFQGREACNSRHRKSAQKQSARLAKRKSVADGWGGAWPVQSDDATGTTQTHSLPYWSSLGTYPNLNRG